MKILEQYVESRDGDPARCEDQVVLSDDYLALLDGATDEGGELLEGMPSGLFAARTIAHQITAMPADMPAEEAFRFLSAALPSGKAQCDAIIYSRSRQEIWRVGTIHLLLDQVPYPPTRRIDEITSAARAAYNQSLLAEGKRVSEIIDDDPGRAFALPLMRRQKYFANSSSSPWGYGVLDGKEIPSSFIEIFPVRSRSEIVFASDGYPSALPTLELSEEALRRRLEGDPLLLENPPSTKGMSPGQVSFDDRAYLRFISDKTDTK